MLRKILITGANSGIGKAVAIHALRQDHHLLLLVRDPKKGEGLRQEFMHQYPEANVNFYHADLSIQQQVRDVAVQILNEHQTLDIIVNNAGFLGMSEYTQTADGMEMTLATNYLSQFILTLRLLPILVKGKQPQIVSVGSAMSKYGNIKWDAINHPEPYKPLMVYADSKRMVTEFIGVLAKRLTQTGVKANCVDPGTVNTNIAHSYKPFFQWAFRIAGPFMRSPEKGSEVINYLIDETPPESGSLWTSKRKYKRIASLYSEDEMERLWNLSLTLTGEMDPTIEME